MALYMYFFTRVKARKGYIQKFTVCADEGSVLKFKIVNWLVGSLAGLLAVCLIYCATDCLTHSLTDSMTD